MNSDKFNDSFFVHSKIPSTVRLFSVFFDKEEKNEHLMFKRRVSRAL